MFFDDARLFKAHGDGPHFPADDIVIPAIQFRDIIGPSHDYGESHNVEDSEGFSLEIEMRNLSKVLQDSHRISESFTGSGAATGAGAAFVTEKNHAVNPV